MIPSYLLLCFASFAVAIHCSAATASLWLRGERLPNNSYVDFRTVGNEGVGVQCRTDLETCCSGTEGAHRGDWFFPDGSKLPFSNDFDAIIQARTKKTVELRRRNREGDQPPGIYRCSISVSPNGSREELFVGLYPPGSGGKW